MVQRGLQRVSWGRIFQSSSMPASARFRDARKQRTRRVQLHVGLCKGSPGSSLVSKAFLWGHFWMVQRGSQRISWGLIFHSSSMTPRDTFRDARKERTRRVQLHVGLRNGSPGEFSCTQSLPLGALLDGRKGLATHFLVPDFSVVSDDC